jgi:squalene-hopene/tetraprenyl-beta-curcumene cyclase
MKRPVDRLGGKLPGVLLLCVALAVPSETSRAQSPAPGKQPAKPAANSPDEPMAETMSLVKSAEFLDTVTLAWIRERKCASCHTGYPYLLARASLGDPKAPALLETRKFFEDRVAAWDKDGKGAGFLKADGPLWYSEAITEVVAVAATLALHDAQSTGKLHPVTRQALDRMWTLQDKNGAWAWNKTAFAPLEHDIYFGAVYAAVGVGHAPDDYARSAAAKDGVARLTEYLRKNPPPDLHHKTWLLWAAVKLDGLMPVKEQQQTIKELLALQRGDGGWSLPSLGDWKRADGKTNNKQAPSDGYATGLILYVLRQAGVAATAEPIGRGVKWLKTNQRVSGRWFTRSLNRDSRHYITHAGTAYAVLALKACEVPDRP